MCFGDDLSFNQVGYESPDSKPAWEGIFPVDNSKPSHYFAWVVAHGEVRNITRVKRSVTRYHPDLFAAIEQEIEAEDDSGTIYHFKGQAIAMAQLPSWPNNILIEYVNPLYSTGGPVSVQPNSLFSIRFAELYC